MARCVIRSRLDLHLSWEATRASVACTSIARFAILLLDRPANPVLCISRAEPTVLWLRLPCYSDRCQDSATAYRAPPLARVVAPLPPATGKYTLDSHPLSVDQRNVTSSSVLSSRRTSLPHLFPCPAPDVAVQSRHSLHGHCAATMPNLALPAPFWRAFIILATFILDASVLAIAAPAAPNASDSVTSSLLWGPYRPNLYFGMRPRIPESVLTGLMWTRVEDNKAVEKSMSTRDLVCWT